MVAPVVMSRSSRDEEDLRWFFNESDGAIGLHSNYPGMILQILLSPGTPPSCRSEPDPFGLASAERARHIQRRLEAIAKEDAQTLTQCFDGDPPEGLESFGRAAALVPQSHMAVDAWQQSGTTRSFLEWLSRLPRRLDEPGLSQLVASLKAEAEHRLVVALLAYREARRRGVAHG